MDDARDGTLFERDPVVVWDVLVASHSVAASNAFVMHEMQRVKRIWVLIGLLALLFSGVACDASDVTGHRDATTLPGTVEQSASATDAGVTVEVQGATFSATAVDVELQARAVDDTITIVSISPRNAAMEGLGPTFTSDLRAGAVRMRFPPGAWTEDTSTARLSIRTVTVWGDGLEQLAGEWDLTIAVPQGRAAEAAREVVALESMTVDLAGHDIAVEAFLTPSETVIRHPVEPPFIHIPAPRLHTADGEVELIESEPWGGLIEHRYGPVGPDDSLALVFQHVVVAGATELWALELALETDAAPPLSPGSTELDWQVESTGEHPDVLRVEVVRRLAGDVQLILTFDGSDWRPGPTRPVIFGDDVQMDVASAGWSVPDGRRESSISIRVDDPGLPRTLMVSARDREREVTLPSTEVVIRR